MKKQTSLRIGDRVKLTEEGYHFQHNIDEKITSIRIPGEYSLRDYDVEGLLCEVLAVQGTGVIKHFNHEGDPFVKWTHKNAGMFFYYSFHYGIDDVRKLTLWEKLCSYFN